MNDEQKVGKTTVSNGIGGFMVKIIVNNEIIKNDTLKWRGSEETDIELTLDEISSQLIEIYRNTVFYVWEEGPLYGNIYLYGNYGPYWVEHGKTNGYA